MHKKIMIALLGSAVLMVGGQVSAQTLGNAIDSVLQQPNDRERNRDVRRNDRDARYDRSDDRKQHDERRRGDHPYDDGHPGKAKGHYKDKAQGRAVGHHDR